MKNVCCHCGYMPEVDLEGTSSQGPDQCVIEWVSKPASLVKPLNKLSGRARKHHWSSLSSDTRYVLSTTQRSTVMSLFVDGGSIACVPISELTQMYLSGKMSVSIWHLFPISSQCIEQYFTAAIIAIHDAPERKLGLSMYTWWTEDSQHQIIPCMQFKLADGRFQNRSSRYSAWPLIWVSNGNIQQIIASRSILQVESIVTPTDDNQ